MTDQGISLYLSKACRSKQLRTILVILTGLILLDLAINPVNRNVHAFTFEDYYQIISQNLGSGYADQYYRLVKGPYNHNYVTAMYEVYAFQQGWQLGYYHGTVVRSYVENGTYDLNKQYLDQHRDSWYGTAIENIRGWSHVNSEYKPLLELIASHGWGAGYKRGYTERLNAPPNPSQFDFDLYWSPAGLADPGAEGEDPWGDLRNVPIR